MELKVIGHIHTEFKDKFGIPRQSGLVPELRATITFEKEYRGMEAFRGIEGFSHLWLLFEFNKAKTDGKHLTVRPPRLGGNTRMGVFATRSPFRPNSIGLSCVSFVSLLEDAALGPVLVVAGADLLDGTPIFDIKPYLPYVDAKPEAVGGFAEHFTDYALEVRFPQELEEKVPEDTRKALIHVLSLDPRPGYQEDEERIYGMSFAGYEVKFMVKEETVLVTACEYREVE